MIRLNETRWICHACGDTNIEFGFSASAHHGSLDLYPVTKGGVIKCVRCSRSDDFVITSTVHDSNIGRVDSEAYMLIKQSGCAVKWEVRRKDGMDFLNVRVIRCAGGECLWQDYEIRCAPTVDFVAECIERTCRYVLNRPGIVRADAVFSEKQ